jgi:hypothetical protein
MFLPNAETLSILKDERGDCLMGNVFEICLGWVGKVSYLESR